MLPPDGRILRSCLSINKLSTNMTNTSEPKDLKKKRKDPKFEVFNKKYLEQEQVLLNKITRNNEHIERIEKLLNQAPLIPIKDKHKLTATNWAIEKKAPFHRLGTHHIFLKK